jgi:hypothetical protein
MLDRCGIIKGVKSRRGAVNTRRHDQARVSSSVPVFYHRSASTCPYPQERAMPQTRENNPNWRGGRLVASNGYVLIRVGVGHPLADVRGYAYEHRVVAQQKIGRALLPGEQVHHIDGNKQNNDPRNLEVVGSIAEHFVYHRTSGVALRMPGENNPAVECACGCGEVFNKYDGSGRPRKFVSGHNPPLTPTQDAILRVLINGPASISDVVEQCRLSRSAARMCLSKMSRTGAIYRVGNGIYAIEEV